MVACGAALPVLALGACQAGAIGADGGSLFDAAPPLAALPAPTTITTDRFASSDVCAQCHLANAGTALRDAAGRDVSPVGTWRASMMALAARDPYYLAAFGEELARRPAAAAAVTAACTRCHGPAGNLEAETGGGLSFDRFTAATDPAATLARDGVTCTLCHQIAATGLGDPQSFTGGFSVGYGRTVYGPHAAPFTTPMMTIVNYTPAYGAHILSGALCGTCHTVLTQALDANGQPVGGLVAEQATYLEWKSSRFALDGAGGKTCAACHLPTTDDDGATLSTPLATNPTTLKARSPIGRHLFVGGNAYMLRLLGANAAWAGYAAPPADLDAAATRAEAHLASAAKLEIVDASRAGGELVVRVRVGNQTGHKLPTGYPGRRMWLHVTVTQAGATAFESGALDASGHLVAGGTRLDAPGAVLAHIDTITTSSQVQVWEAVLSDAGGAPTDMTLSATGYAKDDRILPEGWAPAGLAESVAAPVGVGGDADYAAGGADVVTYRVALPAGAAHVKVELRFQSVPPRAIERLIARGTAAAVRFAGLAGGGQVGAVTMATVETDVP